MFYNHLEQNNRTEEAEIVTRVLYGILWKWEEGQKQRDLHFLECLKISICTAECFMLTLKQQRLLSGEHLYV